MPRPSKVLTIPKLTTNRIDLNIFRLDEKDISKNYSVKKAWDLYNNRFDSFTIKEKMDLNKIMSRILGRYWVVMGQGRSDWADYELTKSLRMFYDLYKRLR